MKIHSGFGPNSSHILLIAISSFAHGHWQNGFSSFQDLDSKLDRFMSKHQHIQMNLLYFQKRHTAEPSKIGHLFTM